MRKRKLKRIVNILLLTLLIVLTGIKLFSNKNQSDKELNRLQAYEQVTPVTIITAHIQPVEEIIEETGQFRPYREVNLISETQGLVLKINAPIGHKVRQGEVLATIDRGLLEQQLALARLNLQNAGEDLQRFEKLLASDAVTHQQAEQVELNYQNAINEVALHQEQLENTTIIAPVEGYISSRRIESGSYITPGMSLMTISQQSQLLFVVQVAESSLNRMLTGEKVLVSPAAEYEAPVEGLVHEIAVNSSNSGRYEVSIKVPNSSCSLKPGMTGHASFQLPRATGIVLPRKCIISSILNPSVYIVSGDSVLERGVKARVLTESQVLITNGLMEGDRVVLSGHMNLSPGTEVRITN